MSAVFLRWAGGKRKLVPRLQELFPARYRRYYEPFMGGGALFFATTPERAILSDLNEDLMETYRWVAAEPLIVGSEVRAFAAFHEEEGYYYSVRKKWNERGFEGLQRAAAFIYLNQTSYNGLWRVNQKGYFNVPKGDQLVKDAIYSALIKASAVLRKAELRQGDFEEAISDAQAGDFVYLDPPYSPRSPTSKFTNYTASGFSHQEQERLAVCVGHLTQKGVAAVVSNSDLPDVRQLYPGHRMLQVSGLRSISCKGATRRPAQDLLITNTNLLEDKKWKSHGFT